MRRLFSKDYRWAWVISLILLFGFLSTSISSYLATTANVRQTITESTLPLTSDNVYSEIQRDLLKPVFISSLMAHDTFLRDWAINGEEDADAVVRYLNEIKVKYGTVTSFFISEKTRRYFHAHGLLKEIREDEPRDAWYFRVRELQEAYEINVDADLANADEMTIFINYRVYDYEGQFIGVTGVGLTIRSVNNLISRYEAKFERQIFFVDDDGNIVLRPMNSPLLGYDHIDEIEGLRDHSEALLGDKQVQLSYERDGETRLLNSRYVPELDWHLFVEQNESAMLGPVRRQLAGNILLALAATAIVALICIRVVDRQQRSLRQQNERQKEISAEKEAQKRALAESADELKLANESLEIASEEKDEFISILAHDLRNPLNSVIGICHLSEEESDLDILRPFFREIKQEGEAMSGLIDRLLDVSMIESFSGDLGIESIDVCALIRNVVETVSFEASRKNIALDLELKGCEGLSLDSQPDWLSVCFTNLLSNALKYSPHGGKVTVTARRKDGFVEFAFADNGPGISDKDQQKLFGKFVRLSARPSGNEPSLGLGLYIVKKMCDRLGFEVTCRSKIGQGATFLLRRPLSS